ncbi:MAG: TetR/AcrR family transcriptional regulator [Desulfobacteraceae bacterium]|nr:TetR/AcrR family transcriptional regulator [Desulfobacteraceae bacterium]
MVGKKIGGTKKKIMEAAMEVFAEKVFSEATISEIAKKAGIGDATIYEYFKNKEDLLFNIPEEKMSEIIPTFQLHLQGIKGALNELRKFIWVYLWVFESSQDWTAIMLLRLGSNRNFVQTNAYELTRKWSRMILQIVEDGKEEGSIRKEINPYVVRDLIIGYIDLNARRWLLTGKPESLMNLTDELADTIIAAVRET